MAVGTTSDFNLGRNEIIKSALRKLRVYNPAQQLSGTFVDIASEALNLLIRSWQADGLHVWTEDTGVVFSDQGVAEYTLATSGGSRSCNLSDLVSTTLSADEASGQTVLSITSTSGMTAADEIGILLDDGTMQWTTIVTVDSSTQVTVTDALTGDAASGNTVYAFTTRLGKLYRVHDDIRRRDTTNNETPIFLFSRQEYNLLSDKTSQGTVNQVYYQPLRSTGKMYVWPTPDNETDLILFTYERDLLDFDTANDTPDLPQEWTRALVWALAAELAPEFGIPMDRMGEIVSRANSLKESILGWDNDVYSIRLQPDYRGDY